MENGYLAIVLHAHLPFVRHLEHPEFLEEDWLFEAMTETYIPLIMMCDKLISQGVHFRLTISITPPLLEMLSDSTLQERYEIRIIKLIELAHREVARTYNRPEHKIAVMYRNKFASVYMTFLKRCRRNLINAFRELQEKGCIEIITSCATHAFLPHIESPNGARAQIRIGVENYKKHFGCSPRGFWLPECAYTDGVDEYLREEGIKYFITDTHGVLFSRPRPKYGIFAPVITRSGVAIFGRDPESSKQVWSSKEGYPGDASYREFYKDLGYDADYDYIRPYLHGGSLRRHVGVKYHRITGNVPLGEKQFYDPDAAREKAAEHAGNFMFNRGQQITHYAKTLGITPIIVAPYDAELFGHWWYEGVDFLEYLFLKLLYDQKNLRPVSFSEYLAENIKLQIVEPCSSSWGAGGFYEVWLNSSNDWIYRHLHKAEERMVELAYAHQSATGLVERALNQMVRELVLAQASDWAFIMTTNTQVPYAQKRVRDHINRFNRLYWEIKESSVDLDFLADLENKDNIFKEVSFKVYL
ncbi:MAG: 1,4-alpha-glucan branching protein domain-containing protein [Planctomycetota bacterium]